MGCMKRTLVICCIIPGPPGPLFMAPGMGPRMLGLGVLIKNLILGLYEEIRGFLGPRLPPPAPALAPIAPAPYVFIPEYGNP